MILTPKNKTTICPLPFKALSYNMLGDMGPCTNCNLVKHKSITEYWNSKELKQLRNDMLNGIRNPVCNECYRREDSKSWNMREYLNEALPNFVFTDDASITDLHVKFSNICNYMCIDCNFSSSSLIWKEDVDRGLRDYYKLFNDDNSVKKKSLVVYPENDENAVLNQIKPIIDNIDKIAFSGGDPLYHWQQYDLLQHMVDNKIFPELHYYTNLSRLVYKNYNLIELWKNFPSLHIMTGFDAMGDGCDYFRKNMNFDETVTNMRAVKDNVKNSNTVVVVTFTWVNAINACDMVEWFVNNHPDFTITYNIVIHDHLDMRIAPKHKKEQIQKSLDKLVALSKTTSQWNVDMVHGLSNYMWQEDWSDRFPNALQWIKDLDTHRKQDFRVAFKEHSDIDYSDYISGYGV